MASDVYRTSQRATPNKDRRMRQLEHVVGIARYSLDRWERYLRNSGRWETEEMTRDLRLALVNLDADTLNGGVSDGK